MDPRLIDKRIVERNIEDGKISRKDYEKHCAALPDLMDECEEIDVSLYNTDEDDADEDGDETNEEINAPEGQTEGQ